MKLGLGLTLGVMKGASRSLAGVPGLIRPAVVVPPESVDSVLAVATTRAVPRPEGGRCDADDSNIRLKTLSCMSARPPCECCMLYVHMYVVCIVYIHF